MIINLEFRNLDVTTATTMRATRFRAASSRSGLAPTIRSRLSPSSPGDAGPSSGTGEEVKIDGWLKSVRGHKNVVFAEVNDGSSSEGLQAVFKGSSRVDGYVSASPRSSSSSACWIVIVKKIEDCDKRLRE